LDWTYLLLEWLVVNALRKGRDGRRPQSTCPEPLYPEPQRLQILRSALESGAAVHIVYFSASSGQETERVVTPEALWQAHGPGVAGWVCRNGSSVFVGAGPSRPLDDEVLSLPIIL
jgi:hypothetical protein